MRGASMPFRGWLTLTLTAVLFAAGPPASAQPRRPVYVGAKICATCHDGENMGHQTTLWLYSRHANAYASLATPEARAIAAISGVPIEPPRYRSAWGATPRRARPRAQRGGRCVRSAAGILRPERFRSSAWRRSLEGRRAGREPSQRPGRLPGKTVSPGRGLVR